MLARALAKPSNLLVLDEPTNDLDLETLDVLEEMLGDYEGTVILISHDRDFLDRVVTSVIVPEGNGRWIEYAGGYTDMLRAARRGSEARGGQGGCRCRGEEGSRRRSAFRSAKAPAEFQRKARAGNAAEDDRQAAGRDRKAAALLDDPDLYAKDRKKFDEASAAIATAQHELAAAEDRWLELEVLREEIEQA